MSAKWSVALLCSIVLVVLSILPASAAVTGLPAVDGDGLMSVAPTNLAYGTTTPLIFTFTANNDFGAGSQVALTIPTGWTAPTTGTGAGHVSVSAGTCTLSGSPPWAVSGMVIFVDMASCLTGQSFTVTYNGSGPGVSGSPFTFTTQTDIGPGGAGLVNITAGSPAVTVDPKALTVSGGLTPTSRMYDGTTAASVTIGSPSLIGVINLDSVALDTAAVTAAFVNRDAGSNKSVTISGLALTGAQAANYTITPPARFANITQAPITITAATDTKIYDGTVTSSGAPTITSGAIQSGDTAPAWGQTFNNKNAGPAKTLTPSGVINDGNSGNNYAYTYATAAGVINQMPITVNAVTNTKVYNGNSGAAAIPTNSGVAPGDAAAFIETYSNKSAGTGKILNASGIVNDGNAGNNYSYAFNSDSTGVITPKALTVSGTGLTPNNKIYDGTPNGTGVVGSPTLVGVISPDVVTLVTSGATYTFADRNAGNGKVVYVSGLTLGGAQAGNYWLTQPNRAASITKRPLTVTAVTDNRVYDGTNHSSGVPTRTSGVIQAGDVEPAWTQTFNNKNVGTGKALTPAGAVVDGNSGNNYAYTFVPNTTGIITKMPLTVTALSDTKIYDGSTHSADIPNYSPALVGTDIAAFTQSFNTKDVGTGKTLTPAGVANDDNGGNNYLYTFAPNTTGVITVRAITVTASTDSKSYDGTVASTASPQIVPPLFGTDTSGFMQSFNTKDVGTGKVLTAAGVVNDGNGGADYSVTFATDSTGVISAKAITVTADALTKAVGTGDPTLTYQATPTLFAPDVFGGTLARAPGETYGVYPINQGTLTAGSNYTITFVGADFVIGPAISGNVGVAGAALSYTDGVLKTVTADGSGNYSLIVTSGWTGSVTPSMAGYAFTPASLAYSTPITSDVTGQNYVAHPLLSLSARSNAAQDGWILETGEKTSIGGTINAANATILLGDDASRKQYRSILSFTTSGLPPTAVITNVALTLKKQSVAGGGDPFAIFQGLLVDVRKGYFGTTNTLQAVDFQAGASTGKAGLGPFSPVPVGSVYTITLPGTAYPYIRGPLTQFRLRFKLDDNNNSISNRISFYSGNYGAASARPTLTITYYIP